MKKKRERDVDEADREREGGGRKTEGKRDSRREGARQRERNGGREEDREKENKVQGR